MTLRSDRESVSPLLDLAPDDLDTLRRAAPGGPLSWCLFGPSYTATPPLARVRGDLTEYCSVSVVVTPLVDSSTLNRLPYLLFPLFVVSIKLSSLNAISTTESPTIARLLGCLSRRDR